MLLHTYLDGLGHLHLSCAVLLRHCLLLLVSTASVLSLGILEPSVPTTNSSFALPSVIPVTPSSRIKFWSVDVTGHLHLFLGHVKVLFVSVSVLVIKLTVPVASGNVAVLSAVGLVAVIVSSLPWTTAFNSKLCAKLQCTTYVCVNQCGIVFRDLVIPYFTVL